MGVMGVMAKALANLYRRNKITKDGLKQAVFDCVITETEYQELIAMLAK